ncbi:MAG: uracil-DNA glycosylase [Planctomycetes bacterium]|nr:uracil-DNA glycosylase [Planctomycetota bacterium]
MSEEPQNNLNRAILQTLESLHAAGVQQLAKPPAAPPPPASSLQQAGTPAPASLLPSTPAPLSALTLNDLQTEVAACTLCEELATTRTQTVFGVGNPQAKLCFLGEAPGADEDRLGEPFVGRGGQLLDKILAACNLDRQDVYLLNILRCRPPNNRNPTEQESQNCRQFLERQLQLIAPEFICCLGAVAAQNLLSTTVTIGRLRGKLHDYRGIKVVCTYHPAYLLRNPSAKKETWDDMQMLMREMGTPVGE